MKKIATLILIVFTLVFSSACSCGKSSEPTNSDYSEAFDALITNLYPTTTELTVNTLSYIDSSQSQDGNYNAVGAYIRFLREAFKNENFNVLGQGTVYLTSTAKLILDGRRSDMPMNAYLKIEYTDGKIKTDMYQNDEREGESVLVIDIEYDFSKKELKGFDMYLYYDLVTNIKVVKHYKSDGSKIFILEETNDADYQAASAFASARLNGINGSIEGAKNVGDYSQEYTVAMVEQINVVFGEGTARAAEE